MRRAFLGWLVITLLACGEAEPDPKPSDDESSAVRDKERDAGRARDAGSVRNQDAGGDGGRKSTPPLEGKPEPNSEALPCAVAQLLDKHCGKCHGDQPQAGAPMSLVSLSDFQAVTPKAKKAAYMAAIERIEKTGPGTMPPSPNPALAGEERATLLEWLKAEAPGSSEACEPSKPAAAAGTDPTTSEAAATDCDVELEFRAYGAESGKKFPIPPEDDHYECFYFKANVDKETLATSLSPLLDDTRVLHHWLLFAADNENESPSGTHRRCDGIHPGAYLMAAWLPGTPALILPENVGMEMPSGPTAQFILENHYNNIARYQGASDNSGVKVCATNKPKQQHAAIHWLGSERITLLPGSMGSAAATCTPASQEPVHILGVIPHMHRLGRHATMTIQRKDGSSEVMHEGAFEFENQTYYPKQLVLNPGDKVRTKCDYMNTTNATVTLGEKTTQEMCYMFTLAYPVGSMNTGGDYVNPLTGAPFVQGPNRCMK